MIKSQKTKINEPKILVISNNAFSETSNNGKTLASFFEGFSPENVAQLYFNEEIPNGTAVNNFFRITDKDIIKSILKKKYKCGDKIYKSLNGNKCQSKKKIGNSITMMKKYNIVRLIREVSWALGKWKSDSLDKWLDDFSPDIVFFCAGDSGFAYNICNYIQMRYRSRIAIYITDDYVLPRKTLNLLWWIRRNYILQKMKYTINRSDLFVTISQKMRDVYKDIFGKDSIIAVNMTESMKFESLEEIQNDYITFVYAGGFHYKRYKVLNLLAKSIRKYNDNKNNAKKVCLKIYSNQKPDSLILKQLNIEGASSFLGSLNLKELKNVLNSCDILVHVESFDKRSVEATRLSISTKIPEYLSLYKPVIAIGPKEVASMEYLKDTAFCITDQNCIYDELVKFIEDKEFQTNLSKRAFDKYERNHKREILVEKFKISIFDVMKK